MIVLFFLGVAAGMLNVYRAVTGVRGPVGYRTSDAGAGMPQGKWDDEDC
jgi:F0F1-type ATP synthase assembly protein I